jgi:RNA polymerase sigma-70 factor (ECF subfamily)
MSLENKPTSDLISVVKRAKEGDKSAFEQLYNEYFAPLNRYIIIRVGDVSEAEDLTQLVFIKFYKNLVNWQDKGYQPSAYLFTIARSVIADYYRSKGRKGSKLSNSEEVLALISDSSQNPHQDVIESEEIRTLYQNLKKLPEKYQEVLMLRYIENLSSKEISQVINKSDVATRKMLSRAVSALADISKKNINTPRENKK